MKKICVVTGTRADYGLLRWVIEKIQNSPTLKLQVIATGMHLSPEFGMTVKEIEDDGIRVDRRVEMLLSSDTPIGVTKSMSLGLAGFADALAELQPNLLLVLGDRFEIISAAIAAMIARIPIAHLHGGESTEGLIDEAIRHSLTKMSHLHFVATETYRQRVIQLGESPKKVFCVGGLGIDSIMNLRLLDREQLEHDLEFKFAPRNLLITFHPVTLEKQTCACQMRELLLALGNLKDTGLIFTMPNADTESRALFKQIEIFCGTHPRAKAYTSLGQKMYLSCIRHVDAVIGNSSSGLMEVPSFQKGTINIGDRQKGRIRAESVIDCEPQHASISAALTRLFSSQFQVQLAKVKNPYGSGGASEAIVNILEKESFSNLLKKIFYDVIKA